jgi:uncharacterized membrane protein YccC
VSEDRSTENSDSQRVLEALNTIAQVLVGEDLKSIRESVKKMDSKQSERIEALNERASAAVGELREDVLSRLDGVDRKVAESEESHKKDMLARLEELSQRITDAEESRKKETHSRLEELDQKVAESKESQQKAINDFEEVLRETAGDLKKQLEETREQAENGVGALKTSLEHELAGRDARSNWTRSIGTWPSCARNFSGNWKLPNVSPPYSTAWPVSSRPSWLRRQPRRDPTRTRHALRTRRSLRRVHRALLIPARIPLAPVRTSSTTH